MVFLLTIALLSFQEVDSSTSRAGVTIQGKVTDSENLAMPSVEVLLRSNQEKLPRVTLTDERGVYLFPKLVQGVYEMLVGAPDFIKETRNLELQSSMELDFTLKVPVVNTCPGPGCGVSTEPEALNREALAAIATNVRRASAERLAG